MGRADGACRALHARPRRGGRAGGGRRPVQEGGGRVHEGAPLRDVRRHHAAHRREDPHGAHVVREALRARSEGGRQGRDRRGIRPCGRHRASVQAQRPERRQGEEREGKDKGSQTGGRVHRRRGLGRQALPVPGHHDLRRHDASLGKVHEAPPGGVRQALRQDAQTRRVPVRRGQMAQERQAERIPLRDGDTRLLPCDGTPRASPHGPRIEERDEEVQGEVPLLLQAHQGGQGRIGDQVGGRRMPEVEAEGHAQGPEVLQGECRQNALRPVHGGRALHRIRHSGKRMQDGSRGAAKAVRDVLVPQRGKRDDPPSHTREVGTARGVLQLQATASAASRQLRRVTNAEKSRCTREA